MPQRKRKSPLKASAGTVLWKIEVMRIFMRRPALLNQTEESIALCVILDSWRWWDPESKTNMQFTRDEVTIHGIARATGLQRRSVQRVWGSMVSRHIIILASDIGDRKLRASFNEHWESWGASDSDRQGASSSDPSGASISDRGGASSGDRASISDRRHPATPGGVNERPQRASSGDPPSIITTYHKEPTERGGAQKTRAPTVCEKHFTDGFAKKYGTTCEIKKGHAIKLGQRVTRDGTERVRQKIDAWWNYQLPKAFAGCRTIGAFLGWYDSIPITGQKDADEAARRARYDRSRIPSQRPVEQNA